MSERRVMLPDEREQTYNEGMGTGLFVGILGGAGLMMVILQGSRWLRAWLGVC